MNTHARVDRINGNSIASGKGSSTNIKISNSSFRWNENDIIDFVESKTSVRSFLHAIKVLYDHFFSFSLFSFFFFFFSFLSVYTYLYKDPKKKKKKKMEIRICIGC